MELTLNDLVAALVWSGVLLVAFLSVASRFLHARAERRITRSRVVCRLCGGVFVPEGTGKITQCTSCGKPNLRRRNGTLG